MTKVIEIPPKTCSIDECETKVLARGWCRKHYYRWHRSGDPEKTSRYMTPSEALKNLTNWDRSCLIWSGTKTRSGYGLIAVEGKNPSVHRYVWELVNGVIPDGMEIDHSCHNRACVNIKHLRLATRSQNTSNKSGPRVDNKASGVRNVYRAKNGWTVQMTKDGEQHYFGLHSTKEEASVVAEKARQELFGAFAGKG